MALQPGDILHERYKILSILGQGGMGAVYHALDTTLAIEVAIKENLFGSAEYAEQFKQEARLLATLRHPNLPRVTDYFVIENQGQYLVMDYIEGEDLKTRIERQGRISVQEAVVIGLALCDALEYLHSQDPPVVHRDIKPGNVRITPEGHVFLVDFGLAKIGGSDQRTVTGAQAVTPGFSPPEQYGTAHTAPYSDLYGLAATLYMALAGEPPPDAFERALDHAELRPLDEINPDVPPTLAQIIETALALQPTDRFRSASEMKAALLSLGLVPDQQQHLQDHAWVVAPPPASNRAAPQPAAQAAAEGSGAPPEPPSEPPASPPPADSTPPHQRRGRAWLWLLLIIAVLALWYRFAPETLLNTAMTIQQRSTRWGQTYLLPIIDQWLPPTPTSIAVMDTTATVPPAASATTISATAPAAAATLPSTATATPEPTSTPALASPFTPAPTPLGNSGQLAYASLEGPAAQIWLIDTQTRTRRQITDRPGGACQPAWMPDGQALAFIAPCRANTVAYTNTQIYLLNLQTNQIAELTSPEWGGYDPAISPDGRHMVFTSARDGAPRLYLLDMRDHTISPLLTDPISSAQAAWSPDGRTIAFVALETWRIWLVPFDPVTGKADTPRPFSRSGNKRNAHPTWAGDGSLLVYNQIPDEETLPYLVKTPADQNGIPEIPIAISGLAMREPAASPDGRWLAFEGWNPNHDIYIIPIDGSQAINLTQTSTLNFDPAWRPALSQR